MPAETYAVTVVERRTVTLFVDAESHVEAREAVETQAEPWRGRGRDEPQRFYPHTMEVTDIRRMP